MSADCIKIIGLIGSALLCLCGLPEAWSSFKNKNSDGLTSAFVVLWGIGEIFMLTYVLIEHPNDIPLLINYIISAFTISIISYFKFFPRRNNGQIEKYIK